MKILILGGSGMLGHRLWMNLRKKHKVWVTVRGENNPFPSILDFPEEFIRYRVDGMMFEEITRAFASIQPDIVINCIGLIKQMGHLAKDPLFSITINSLLPHRISLLCRTAKIRMIHISTDCVFSGKKGNYSEKDQSDAEDLYGRTKFLGELLYPHCVTLRTSIIGMELKNRLGLIDWFLNEKGPIKGYKKAIFSGFTTDELSRIIENYVIPNDKLHGLYQVSSDPISKYVLLNLANKYCKKNIEILPDDNFFCDRSLDSSIFQQQTGYQPPTWDEMICELSTTLPFYEALRGEEYAHK
jgi:dTDP-4-dehydrorhamnose reductase